MATVTSRTRRPAYVWVLSNRKPVQRRGYVQLIDASEWYRPLCKDLGSVKVEYQNSFTRYSYQPQPLRAPEEIWADSRALEREADGLLEEIRGGV